MNILIISVQIKDEKGVYFFEKAIASVTLPLLEFSKKSANTFTDVVYTYILNVNASKKLNRLSSQVTELKSKLATLENVKRENGRLRELLGLTYRYNFKFIGSRVINNTSFAGSNIITIDKGANSGVKENSAVMDGKGIVGRIWKLFPNQSQVQLISDTSSGVGVIIGDDEIGGVLKGTGSLKKGKIDYVSKEFDIKKGDVVLTSGTDGIYPPNLPVGIVVEVKKGEGFFLDITVEFFANLSGLKHVVVIVERKEN